MTDFPDLKVKALVNFPANVIGDAGIDIVKTDGAYHLNIAYDDFAPVVTGIVDPANQTVLTWNTVTEQYALAPISVLTGSSAEFLALSGVQPYLGMDAFSGAINNGPWMYMTMARGTQASPAAVQVGDEVFGLWVGGWDGAGSHTDFSSAIEAKVDGAISDGHVPIAWVFKTGDQSPAGGTERLHISSAGHSVFTPGSTTPPTLATNGNFVLTPTSNTNMRISYRGSDGVTRTANITLAP